MSKTKKLFSENSGLITYLFYFLVIVFIAGYLRSIDWDQLSALQISWPIILLGTFFGLLTRYCGAFTWLVILTTLGAQNISKSQGELFYVYAKSWLGRYIPGTAPWILGKIYFASKHGISKSKLAVSSLLEAGLQILVTTAISLSLLVFDDRFNAKFSELKPLLFLLIALCVFFMLPKVFNGIISKLHKLFKKIPLASEHHIKNETLVKGVLLYSLFVILNGLSLFFIAKGVYPDLSYGSMLYVASTSNLAGIMGMLVVFVPSGIGVREGALVVMLAQIMPMEIAIAIAVVTRLAGVVWDLMFFAVARAFLKIDPKTKLV